MGKLRHARLVKKEQKVTMGKKKTGRKGRPAALFEMIMEGNFASGASCTLYTRHALYPKSCYPRETLGNLGHSHKTVYTVNKLTYLLTESVLFKKLHE